MDTTNAGTKRPTTADEALLGFAQSVELSIRDAYDAALASDGFGPDAPIAITIREGHEAYAQALSGFLGRVAPNVRDEAVFEELSATLRDPASAAGVEDIAVATHNAIIARLEGTDGPTLLASILIVEARHATVLKHLAGQAFEALLSSDAVALSAPANQ